MKINSSRRHGQGNRGNRFPSKDSTIESVGPAGKVRGNLQHLVDRYMALGKEALGGRDFAEAESFFQHAEHYRRLLAQHKATKAPPKSPAPSDDSGSGKTGEKDVVSLKETPTTQRTAGSTTAAAAAEELPSFLVTSEAPKETAQEAAPKPVEEKPKTLKRTSVAARKTPSKTTTSTRPKTEE